MEAVLCQKNMPEKALLSVAHAVLCSALKMDDIAISSSSGGGGGGDGVSIGVLPMIHILRVRHNMHFQKEN